MHRLLSRKSSRCQHGEIINLFYLGRRLMDFTFVVRTKLFVKYNRLVKMSNNFSADLGSMRVKYKNKDSVFKEDNLVSKEPFGQFKSWFDEACSTPEILEPNAMCLATCTKTGFPSARYVLLKGYSTTGFKFFTNYCSRKGKELSENPKAALVFYWESLKRSIRIEGNVEKLSEEEAKEYFSSRPKDSQIGAVCSNQSQPVAGREVLQDREIRLKEKYAACNSVPKPTEWGGFILKPHSIEFWQGQSDRIHDRIRFRLPHVNDVIDNVLLHRGCDGWVYERLQP